MGLGLGLDSDGFWLKVMVQDDPRFREARTETPSPML